ncbi:MAG: sigma-54-dependent Fis family transcriptional regulator [Candidatus Tectomicrobia bacterium]|uniref:Sigma-54-dependent Fis family transcriptional regulator n=1 Tax=Tectimicrobiota bacterium TaxID=2528274 RepID=A0A932LZK5_UNCTE|nr:sigma-54-dependent Fis family transcriptional regulator [Candidatus Tectomicrobia bacterium]
MVREKILIIDDEEGIRQLFVRLLHGAKYEVHPFERGAPALESMQRETYDLVITDLRMPGMDGMEVLERVRQERPELPVIVLTGHGTVESAVEAMKRGAYDYITKPVQPEEIELTIEKALREKRLSEENRILKEQLTERYSLDALLGKSPKMRELFQLILQVAPSDAAVLIQGESGTGKELVARAIHTHSARSKRILLSLNCAALPETLLESELFGHEKGAFTGALTAKKGLLEVADGGTLYLDEIGDMPYSLQAKLLRAVEQGEFLRLGGQSPIHVDVRTISSTNRNLKEMVESGKFREDLYYRLNIIMIHVPPLRDRQEDIPLLSEHFCRKFAEKMGKPIKGFAPPAMEALLAYDWPGNVRQLENIIERAVIMTAGETIEKESLATEILAAPSTSSEGYLHLPLKEAKEKLERDYLLRVLKLHHGNVSLAAQEAGIHKTHFYQKLRQYGIRFES